MRPSSQPSSVFKQSPQDETYITEGGFINTNLVQDEESQEFDDLIFALKTGKSFSLKKKKKESLQIFSDYNSFRELTLVNSSYVSLEETQNLGIMVYLHTGSGLNVSDNESIHGSHDGGSVANSQIVELRRIPIADTHL